MLIQLQGLKAVIIILKQIEYNVSRSSSRNVTYGVYISIMKSMKAETDTTSNGFLKVYYISAGQITLGRVCLLKTRPNVKFPLYLKKAGLASRNIVHLQKSILRCVGFCLHILHFICEAD